MREEILHYIIENTDKATFEMALHNHNLHSIYRRKKNDLMYTYFGGNTLRYSNYMTDLFSEFITEGQQIEAAQLSYEIGMLAGNIRRAKKYKSPHGDWVKEHNEKVNHYNELMKGANRLIDLWNKRHKQIKEAA